MIEDHRFEFAGRPALWGAAVMVLVGMPLRIASGDWTLVLFAAFLGGVVASLRCDFYDQHANTGFVSGVIGIACFVPLFFAQYVAGFDTTTGWVANDVLLYASVYTASELVALVPSSMMAGYLGGALTAIVRRKRRAADRSTGPTRTSTDR